MHRTAFAVLRVNICDGTHSRHQNEHSTRSPYLVANLSNDKQLPRDASSKNKIHPRAYRVSSLLKRTCVCAFATDRLGKIGRWFARAVYFDTQPRVVFACISRESSDSSIERSGAECQTIEREREWRKQRWPMKGGTTETVRLFLAKRWFNRYCKQQQQQQPQQR